MLFEKYWDNYSDESLTNSFSMAKSFTCLCIGAAIKEGKVKSTNQLISGFLPEYKGSGIRIKHLLQMSSGIDFGESYGDPFGFMAKAYYGTAVYNLTLSKKSTKPPGVEWKYQGGNTLLLSFIVNVPRENHFPATLRITFGNQSVQKTMRSGHWIKKKEKNVHIVVFIAMHVILLKLDSLY